MGGDPGAAGEAGCDADAFFFFSAAEGDVGLEDGPFEGRADDGLVEEVLADGQEASLVEDGHDRARPRSAGAPVEHAGEGLGPRPNAGAPVGHDDGVSLPFLRAAAAVSRVVANLAKDEDFGAAFAGDGVVPVGEVPGAALDHFAEADDLPAARGVEGVEADLGGVDARVAHAAAVREVHRQVVEEPRDARDLEVEGLDVGRRHREADADDDDPFVVVFVFFDVGLDADDAGRRFQSELPLGHDTRFQQHRRDADAVVARHPGVHAALLRDDEAVVRHRRLEQKVHVLRRIAPRFTEHQ
mmetsp:Transcript_15708/g.51380  ORF Transcript_15708/g.51380 Transcript_15708/m.51380 type:complete len:299 (-) Transcript_15708:166-1062(-)